MSNIQITIDSAQVEALLASIQGKVNHLEPVMALIGHDIAERVRLCFRDLSTPNGVGWKPLSQVTKFNRAKRVSGGKVYIKSGKRTTAKFTKTYLSATPLNDTGALRDSIHYTATADSVEIGTGKNIPYAAMMNFGAKQGAFGKNKRNVPIPWGDIPARPFMPTAGLPDEWEREVMDTINDYLGIIR